MSVHGYSLHWGQTSIPFCLVHWRILQSGGPPPVLHVQSDVVRFCRNCQNVGNVSFISGTYWYQLSILLRVGFVVVDGLVVVCGCGEHTTRSISRSRLHGEVDFVLAWFEHLDGKVKG